FVSHHRAWGRQGPARGGQMAARSGPAHRVAHALAETGGSRRSKSTGTTLRTVDRNYQSQRSNRGGHESNRGNDSLASPGADPGHDQRAARPTSRCAPGGGTRLAGISPRAKTDSRPALTRASHQAMKPSKPFVLPLLLGALLGQRSASAAPPTA